MDVERKKEFFVGGVLIVCMRIGGYNVFISALVNTARKSLQIFLVKI